ncbi:MAG: NAD(+) synthase [Clostridiales bacterium]|nr:NAD(+) synthase [Clostridiales bacterium]
MKNGFIKIAAMSPSLQVADCPGNAAAMIQAIERYAAEGVHVLTFPELSITGYTCSDLFLQKTLLEGALQALLAIASATKDKEILVAVGLPLCHQDKLYNCAAVLFGGEILGFVPKQHIPNYSEFYEARHFTGWRGENQTISIGPKTYPIGTKQLFSCPDVEGFTVAYEICEDGWVPASPSELHAAAGASIICNLSASDEVIGKADYRRNLIKMKSGVCCCAYVYADAGNGESTTDMVFSGHNLICENGSLLAESNPFGSGEVITEVDVQRITAERRRMNTFAANDRSGYLVHSLSFAVRETKLTRPCAKTPFVPHNHAQKNERCRTILEMQAHGLAKRLRHIGKAGAVLGISGGLDSCLALLVCVEAMKILQRPFTDICAVTMPCFGTTRRTRTNAERLCEQLGVSFRCVDISASVRSHFADIGQQEDVHDVAYENAQARERTQVLMDLANQRGDIVIGTGDLSELALGFATYNGDHMSMYGVNSSIPKTLVRHLVAYYAEMAESTLSSILLDILATPVSPELIPPSNGEIAQVTEEIVGPYELHDFFLYYMIRFGFTPAKIYRLAKYAFGDEYNEQVIQKWLKIFMARFFAQQFKRSCLPDGPKVGTVTLSPRGDFRMPSDAVGRLWLAEIDSLSDLLS